MLQVSIKNGKLKFHYIDKLFLDIMNSRGVWEVIGYYEQPSNTWVLCRVEETVRDSSLGEKEF